jgi:hypothetical protein
VSSIVKFFAATQEEAVAALHSGPDPSLPVAVFGNFDAEEALLEWEEGLTGTPFVSLVEKDLPDVVAEIEDGPLLLRISAELSNSLASASSARIRDLAEWWMAEKSAGGAEIEHSAAVGILQTLADLARSACQADVDVYCWIS